MGTQEFSNANRSPAQRSYSLPAHHITEVALILQKSSLYVLNYRKKLSKDLSGYNGSHQVIPGVDNYLEEMNIFPQRNKQAKTNQHF